jgi:plasmid stabilization system protein ParE
MTFTLRFRREVVADLDDARRWYEQQSPGLGRVFLRECFQCLERVQRNPEWVASPVDGLRSVRMRRFPYVVHYRIEGEIVIVFAIMFGGRDPSVWRERT